MQAASLTLLAVTGQHLLFAMNGFTLDETIELGVGDAAPVDLEAANQARDYIAAAEDEFPNLVEVAPHFAFADADQRFELLIDLYVDGLAQRARLDATNSPG